MLVALSSATTLSLASRRIAAEQAAFRAPAAGRCTPTALNRSAVLPGTTLSVSPLPDSYDASPHTQISLLGAPPGAISRRARQRLADRLARRPPARLLPGRRRELRARAAVPLGRDGDRARQACRSARGSSAFAYHFVVARPDDLTLRRRHAAVGQATPTRCSTSTRARTSRRRSIAVTARSPAGRAAATSSPRPTAGPGRAGR